jgi:hypothetical protein
MVRVIACLAEGLAIWGTARVSEVDPNTLPQWLVIAAEQLPACPQHFLLDVRVRQPCAVEPSNFWVTSL